MLAIENNHQGIVKLLIDVDADFYLSTYFEDNPLELAVIKGNIEVVRPLLQAGANADIRSLDNPIIESVGCFNFARERIPASKISRSYGLQTEIKS